MSQLFSVSRRAGSLLFLSGQCGFDESGSLVPGGIGPETEQTLQNIAETLASESLSLADVVAITCYVSDIDERASMDAAYVASFGESPLPTRTTVEVSTLPAGLSVEITAIAAFGD